MTGSARPLSHDASGSMLGYLYQARVALLELLVRGEGNPSLSASIEKFDDVSFETAGRPEELLQTKHSVASRGDLTDTSRDTWRSIRVWTDATIGGQIDIDSIVLSILTTAVAADDSAMSKLRPGPNRNAPAAQSALEVIARTGTQATNQSDYAAFLALPEELRKSLVEAIQVLDGAETISGVDNRLRARLRPATSARSLNALVSGVEGNWILRVIGQLTGARRDPIAWEEVMGWVDAARDQLAVDNLPVDYEIDDELAGLALDDRVFVKQLQLIAANDKLIEVAIADYKRAYVNRTRWAEEDLLVPDELARYERRLVTEWEHHVAVAHQRHDPMSEEPASIAFGLEVYERTAASMLGIRERVRDGTIIRGSYHHLANDLRVGWHPDFVERLRTLLAGST
jgi:hypothetical protein